MKEYITCPTVESTKELTVGMRYSSLGVARFKFLKSMHTLILPFFFITGTILDNHSTYLAVIIKSALTIALFLSSLEVTHWEQSALEVAYVA